MQTLKNRTTGKDVATSVKVAATFWQRFRGLMLKGRLDTGEALAFRPGGSIHMMFMRFPIDAIFCDSEGRVTRVARNLRPWIGIATAPRGSKLLIELGAGAARDVEAGHLLELAESPTA